MSPVAVSFNTGVASKSALVVVSTWIEFGAPLGTAGAAPPVAVSFNTGVASKWALVVVSIWIGFGNGIRGPATAESAPSLATTQMAMNATSRMASQHTASAGKGLERSPARGEKREEPLLFRDLLNLAARREKKLTTCESTDEGVRTTTTNTDRRRLRPGLKVATVL